MSRRLIDDALLDLAIGATTNPVRLLAAMLHTVRQKNELYFMANDHLRKELAQLKSTITGLVPGVIEPCRTEDVEAELFADKVVAEATGRFCDAADVSTVTGKCGLRLPCTHHHPHGGSRS